MEQFDDLSDAEKAFREADEATRTRWAHEALLAWAHGRGAGRIAKWERDNGRKWPGWALEKNRRKS